MDSRRVDDGVALVLVAVGMWVVFAVADRIRLWVATIQLRYFKR